MSNEDSLEEVKEISYYRDKALSMMRIYNKETEESFFTWLNKFEYVTDKIEVPDDKMGELIITMVNDKVNKRIERNCSYDNISELSYQALISQYLHHLNLSNEVNLYRKRFRSRNQYEKETIEKYADSLRKICNKCHYVGNIHNKLCDQFVKGIRDNVIRSLLRETPRSSSFNEKIAKAIEFSKYDLMDRYVDQALLMINSYYPSYEGVFYGWLNKFEYAANNIGVPDDKIVELFNRMVYNAVHMEVKNSFPAINFSKLLYDQVIDYYLRHFSPCEVDLHSSRLKVRKQYEKETVRNYADSLIKIYNKCYFKSDIEDSLCDLFISGLRDKFISNNLGLTLKLPFDKAVAKVIELSKRNLTWYYVHLVHPNINLYKLENEDPFHIWFNKFEYLADIVGVPDNRMIELFNNMVASDVHTNVRKASPSINFFKISYEEIIDNYHLYFSEYYEYDLHRKRFFSRIQYEKETIKTFSEKLKRIYNKLNYKSDTDFELCAQFINGIFGDDIKIHLCETLDLSFDDMVAKAMDFKTEKIFRNINNTLNSTND
ncbi:hypothetical protein M0804_013858 [Polistes exclamans]|nr:hypothetical protein M0804_013858 [Polistes exclamans]